MRNPFKSAAKLDAARPSLRERAAGLKATAARVIRRKSVLPEPNSEEARAMFHAACAETARGEAEVDPILAAIAEGRRLLALSDAIHASVTATEHEQSEAGKAAVAYCDDVILQTVPATAAGCIELARYACDFERSQGVPIADEPLVVFKLIARCPAL